LRILVLGSAAGGGVPQWNCNAPISRATREGQVSPAGRTQASIAVSLDRERWILVNASPDLRQQILAHRYLWPRPGRLRDSPIQAVLLTGSEIDNVVGVLSLRERQPFTILATKRVLTMLDDNPIFEALDRKLVERHVLPLDRPVILAGPEGDLGFEITAFPVPGKVPLYLEGRVSDLSGTPDETIGLEISGGGKTFHYIPGCANLTPEIRDRIAGSELLFFDGTLWRDDEMITAGVGSKTGQRMGHMSMSGPNGSIAALAGVPLRRKLFIHLNNTNPALLPDSTERARLNEAGWDVAADGDEIEL
jgi:pyrroloquinoline quinone biosynthesis protein B